MMEVFGWAINQIFILIGIALLVVLAGAIIAPLESLTWWAGWTKRLPAYIGPNPEFIEEGKDKPQADYYIVYLSGIGVASADGLAKDEFDFINELERIMPSALIIQDVFPYSVNNNPLTGQRAFTSFWKKMRGLQEENPDSLLALLSINIRNTLQVAVSADPRYGPIYSLGIADEISDSLARHGYPFGSGKPVYLIGFSGGGQVAVGVAPYLSPIINAPIYIVSIGGVISDDPGIQQVSHLSHLWGDKDPLQKLGEILWSGRWKTRPNSPWNKHLASGHITFVSMGPMAHNAYGGYYDIRVKLSDGQSFCEATAAQAKRQIEANI
jgi:hypothetical protein